MAFCLGETGSASFWNSLVEAVDNQFIETENITDLDHLVATAKILANLKRFGVLLTPSGKKLQSKLLKMIN